MCFLKLLLASLVARLTARQSRQGRQKQQNCVFITYFLGIEVVVILSEVEESSNNIRVSVERN